MRYILLQDFGLTNQLAIYGAILSTILAIIQLIRFVTEFKEKRRTLRVNFNYELASDQMGEPKLFIRISMVNTNFRPIKIDAAGLLTVNNFEYIQEHYTAGNNPLPIKLEDGENAVYFIDYSDALEIAKNKQNRYKKAFIVDAEGKRYYSKRLPKWVREFTHMNHS
jgi:hypothetical protein